ncbi:TetR/AcrR family transcriptional regulator [Pseudonocardia sp. RS010]|uniref:TetR/AcrR family transcriptional regulator n=1 Tax=Pseudonocardia sp. RS010 TaxID=3385979 RepID=UPI0039A2A81B
MKVDGSPGASVGRKRDPRIEPLVTAAAVTVYARDGWAGFSFEAVAREAGVGKPALYRRWESREELLVQAMDTLRLPTAIDVGSLRADLLDYAYQWVEWYSDQSRGLAALRLAADTISNPPLNEVHKRLIVRPRTEAAREITRRAIDRGEVADTLHSATAIELLVGAMQIHWMYTKESSLPEMRRTFRAHAERLVDIIVAGTGAIASGRPD